MSTTATIHTGAMPHHPLRCIGVAIARLYASYKTRIAFRQGRAQLMALDDRMLRDIGLDRSEIASALVNENAERLNGSAVPVKPVAAF